MRLPQCGFGVAQGELNQQPECNSSPSYVQSNPKSIDNKAFGFAPLLWNFIILYETDVKVKGIRVNEQQYLCLSSHGLNPKWPSGSVFYDVQEILHQSFLTVLGPHVMNSIHEAYRKIDCRPNLRKTRPTCLTDCLYLCVVKRSDSSFLHSRHTRI